MSGGARISLVLLTTAAGGGAAAGVASFLIAWLQIPNREGASGFFALYVITAGVIGGFIVGLMTAALVQSRFWRAQGYALAIVAVLAVVAAILPRILQDDGPLIGGEKLVLEVELKAPRGWKPDNQSRGDQGSFCWLQRDASDAPPETNPIVLGGLVLKTTAEPDGQWVVPCATALTRTRKTRYVRVFIGKRTDVTIQVPLPAKPGPAYKQWSEWTAAGFLPQAGKPAATDYAYRFRVQGAAEYDRQHPDPAAAFQAAREKALAAMPADAPLAQWLPFFENERGQGMHYAGDDYPEVRVLKSRMPELAQLLRSRDSNVVRQAVFATAALDEVPGSLIAPLAGAGRLTIDLIREARGGALPDDPDVAAERRASTYFFYWDLAMEHAGAAGTGPRRAALEAIEREASGSSGKGGIHEIAEQARKDLDNPERPAR